LVPYSIKDEIKSPKMGETSREKETGVEKNLHFKQKSN